MAAEKKVMSLEELRKLSGDDLAEQMWFFRHDFKNSLDSEDEPEEQWSCLVSLVEDGTVKVDDLPGYGFTYLHDNQ